MLKLTFREAQGAAHQVTTTAPAHLSLHIELSAVPTMTVCLRDVSLSSHTNIDPCVIPPFVRESRLFPIHMFRPYLILPIIGNSPYCQSPHWPVPRPHPCPMPAFAAEQAYSSSSRALFLSGWEGGREDEGRGSSPSQRCGKLWCPSLTDTCCFAFVRNHHQPGDINLQSTVTIRSDSYFLGFWEGLRLQKSYKYNTLHTELDTQGETPCN